MIGRAAFEGGGADVACVRLLTGDSLGKLPFRRARDIRRQSRRGGVERWGRFIARRLAVDVDGRWRGRGSNVRRSPAFG